MIHIRGKNILRKNDKFVRIDSINDGRIILVNVYHFKLNGSHVTMTYFQCCRYNFDGTYELLADHNRVTSEFVCFIVLHCEQIYWPGTLIFFSSGDLLVPLKEPMP